MPSPGLSLVGFLPEPEALIHLRSACVPSINASDADLSAIWTSARQKLGAPVANAGNPAILPLPPTAIAHVQALMQQPWVQPAFQQGALVGASFQLVEIDPLLAFQFTVDTARSGHHNGGAAAPPTIDELLAICLPHQQANEQIQVHQAHGSMMLTSRSLNLRMQAQGFLNGSFLGMLVGLALPFVQVVRHNGRCYLHNGFHRSVGLRARGATHLPCVLRDVTDHEAVGLHQGTFNPQLMESSDPPTVSHFTQGRALDVTLKAYHRTLHISWAEYATTHD